MVDKLALDAPKVEEVVLASPPEQPEVEDGEYVCEYHTGEQWKSDFLTYAYNRFDPTHRDLMIRTWIRESGMDTNAISPPNRNGTRDYGFCQLNSAYHSKFINSEDFKDPYKQIDYCLSVYRDAVDSGRSFADYTPKRGEWHVGSVWYGWSHRHEQANKYTCNKINNG